MSEWNPDLSTAPKGEPKSYGNGPAILGLAIGNGWSAYSIVSWNWHKNGKTGSWKGPHGVWEPTHWMSLLSPPATP